MLGQTESFGSSWSFCYFFFVYSYFYCNCFFVFFYILWLLNRVSWEHIKMCWNVHSFSAPLPLQYNLSVGVITAYLLIFFFLSFCPNLHKHISCSKRLKTFNHQEDPIFNSQILIWSQRFLEKSSILDNVPCLQSIEACTTRANISCYHRCKCTNAYIITSNKYNRLSYFYFFIKKSNPVIGMNINLPFQSFMSASPILNSGLHQMLVWILAAVLLMAISSHLSTSGPFFLFLNMWNRNLYLDSWIKTVINAHVFSSPSSTVWRMNIWLSLQWCQVMLNLVSKVSGHCEWHRVEKRCNNWTLFLQNS